MPGDLIGVCAPAGAVDPGLLAAGVEALRGLGFRVRADAALVERHLFAAGTAQRRRQELQDLFADPEVSVVFGARGGAGSGWVLRDGDPKLLGDSGKLFVGCSDLTYLHLALARHRVVSLHGPMVAGDLGRGSWHRESLLHGLWGAGQPYESPGNELAGLRPGSAAGRLLGGCLSILAAACGTPWALRPETEGTILFVEDVNEPAYRIDRMILQLHDAGCFEGVRGVVFGEMPGCQAPASAGFTLEDVILDALAWFDGPVALGLPSGHATRPAITLPLGCQARLSVGSDGAAAFAVTEAALS